MSNGATGDRETSAEETRTDEQSASGADAPEASDDAAVGESQKSQEELRHDIEETREELGDTVDALSQKADVKAQVSQAVDEQKRKVRAKQEEIRSKVSSAGGGSGGDAAERANELVGQLAERASRQPLPYLGGAAATGLVVGLLLRGRRS